MSDIRKITDKMKRQPHNIGFDEARKILEYCGFKIAGIKGSHYRFKNKEGCVFILPRKNPLKAVYIKQILKIYDEKECIK